ncbi:MAG: hypothetical protein EBU88_09865 [Acidobacteria bacterium]|nr:hypothetical protein [Acidobacteriota bacterium]
MSRRGDCWDNAVAESFFSTLKSDLTLDDPDLTPLTGPRLGCGLHLPPFQSGKKSFHSRLCQSDRVLVEAYRASAKHITNVSAKAGQGHNHQTPDSENWLCPGATSVVERNFGWVSRFRRSAREYERLPECIMWRFYF